jgi:hypothetical protein
MTSRGFGTSTRAREEQADKLVREILEIADDASGEVSVIENEDGSTYEKVNQEVVNRARLRVDARKWLAARLAPKKWGNRLAHEHAGPDGRPLAVAPGIVIIETSAVPTAPEAMSTPPRSRRGR